MATKDKDKSEGIKQSLPPGHPQAGYVEPDLSYHEGTGIIPDEEKAWHEERNDAREELADTVADHEHEVAVAEQKEREERAEEERKAAEKQREAEKSGGAAPTAPATPARTQTTQPKK